MANTQSSLKRIKTNERNYRTNQRYKTLVKTFTKKYFLALEQYKISPDPEKSSYVFQLLNETYSKIDKAKKKNIIHKNTAARKKARLARLLSKVELTIKK